jgi:hypothetical protein
MLKIIRTLLPLAAVALSLVPATAAQAGSQGGGREAPIKAWFTATFEAHKTAAWDRPRGEGGGDCNGKPWSQSSGSEDQRVKSRGSFKVVVTGTRRFPTWTFGRGTAVTDPREVGVDASGPHTREWTHRSGRTGGWCGAARTDPPLPHDCGTQLSEYKVDFHAYAGAITWGLSYKNLPRERQGFYKCGLHTPADLPATGFPRLEGKIRMADVLNPRKRRIVVQAAKTYGPTVYPIPDLGTTETRSGAASWKLTLNRTR